MVGIGTQALTEWRAAHPGYATETSDAAKVAEFLGTAQGMSKAEYVQGAQMIAKEIRQGHKSFGAEANLETLAEIADRLEAMAK